MLNENRFTDMYAYLDEKHCRKPSAGSRAAPLAKGQSAERWARSQSTTQRALVVLLDNGGIDLGVATLVDKIIDLVPMTSILPDGWRQSILDAVTKFINDPIKNVTRSALESAELLINRFNAAKPDLYGAVTVLKDSAACYAALKDALISAATAGQIIDVLILTHGDRDRICAEGNITGDMIRGMGKAYGKPLPIRSVYMMNCVGSSLNQAWLDIGAKTSSGTKSNNYLPEPTMMWVWDAWKGGKSFSDAVTGAYARICDDLDAALADIGLSFIHARDFQVIKDSEPVVAGDGSVTIESDSLVFSQSNGYARLNWRGARSMDDAGAPASANSLSPAGAKFIEQFEGFFANLYNDPAGHCTVGYGTLVHRGNCNGAASEQPYLGGVSEAEATRLMTNEVNGVAPVIAAAASQPLNQNQFDALASFVYNVGVGAFHKSTLAKKLKAGQYSDVPAEIRKWTKARVHGKLVDLPGLVKRRKAEADLWSQAAAAAQSLSLPCYGVQLAVDKFDRVASEVYGYADYDEYCAKELTSTTFLGKAVGKVGGQLVDKLSAAEADLKSQGITSGPGVDSTFRRRMGMHGLGLAIDFDVLTDPYILNEKGEADLDKELLSVYNRIADVMLGLPSSAIGRLKKGRAAFKNDIGAVYDALRAESDAMRLYFGMMRDAGKVAAFLSGEWPSKHSGQTAPDASALIAQMREDYAILGGADEQGQKRPTGTKGVDRPFGNRRGDPATGFLSIDRAIVMALTKAGLAWGAIDLGGASGDVMHFDCRLDGKGKSAITILWRG